MGNCMKPSTQRQQEEANMERQNQQEEQELASESVKKSDNFEKGSLKVKIVLTKEELEWLMFQLKVGGKKLEDVLKEIERGRAKGKAWKPSLESIMEIPEAHEVERL